MRQCQHCAHMQLHQCLRIQNSTRTLDSEALTWSSCRLRFSSSRLSVLLKCNVLDSATKKNPKIVLLCDIIRKCYRGTAHRNHSGDHNKGIACRYVVASNRAQVVRSYTCVTTTQPIFPYPLSPAPIVIIERVSHFVTLHRASVSRYSALTRFSCASRSPPSPCPGLEIVCTAAPRCPVSFCPSSPSPFAEVSVPSNARPFNCLGCRSLWIGSDFVLNRSARFSADVHALTMTIPRFTNCCGQRTFVDKCAYCSHSFASADITRSRAVQQEFSPNFQSHEQQDFSDQHCFTGGRNCSISTQLRHLSVRVLECGIQRSNHQFQIFRLD